MPIYYLRDYTTFWSFAPAVIMGVLIWLGDVLVVRSNPERSPHMLTQQWQIYRCLIIWEMNWWIILIPCLLLVYSLGASFPFQMCLR